MGNAGGSKQPSEERSPNPAAGACEEPMAAGSVKVQVENRLSFGWAAGLGWKQPDREAECLE